MLVYVLTLSAALLFAIGTVAQQHAAALAPRRDVMSLKLLLWLVRRRMWLLGVATAAAGNGLAAAALGRGGVALVEPLLVVRLIIALPLAAAWVRMRVPGRDWLGAVFTSVGLGGFIAAGNPSQTRPDQANSVVWAAAIAAVTVLAFVLAMIGRKRRPERQATYLAVGGGLLFATQDALISTAVGHLDHPLALLATWYPYVTVVAAIGGTLFVQSAYELAPLPASFPAQVTAEPVCGVALGVLVLNGSIRTEPWAVALEVVSIAVMITGIFTLARSPLVTGHHLREKFSIAETLHHVHVPHPHLHHDADGHDSDGHDPGGHDTVGHDAGGHESATIGHPPDGPASTKAGGPDPGQVATGGRESGGPSHDRD